MSFKILVHYIFKTYQNNQLFTLLVYAACNDNCDKIIILGNSPLFRQPLDLEVTGLVRDAWS